MTRDEDEARQASRDQDQDALPDYLRHLGDPAGEAHALAVGAALVQLPGRGVVQVSGPDRLSWLTTLSSQVVDPLPAGESRELLLLDAHGHISFAAGIVDDGQRAWLLTDVGQAAGLTEFLERMRFMLRVEVADVSARYATLGFLATGPVAAAVAQIELPGVGYADPWPGPLPQGTSYTASDLGKHPGLERRVRFAVVPTDQCTQVSRSILEAARRHADFPLHTDDGYPVPAPTLIGEGAWEANRVMAWRPRTLREVDARAIPHELDWLRTAVHLSKGCYCGQETVARVINLGRPPRRLVFVQLDGSGQYAPSPGAPLFIGPRQVGHLTSVAVDVDEGPVALALVKRNIRGDEAVVRPANPDADDAANQDEDAAAVAAKLFPIVSPAGRAAASPSQRPGQGVRRLPGAPTKSIGLG